MTALNATRNLVIETSEAMESSNRSVLNDVEGKPEFFWMYFAGTVYLGIVGTFGFVLNGAALLAIVQIPAVRNFSVN